MNEHGSRPLIVGVTGHRNVDMRDRRIGDLVTREIRRLSRRHGNAPLLVLSGLAEGADRMVVDAARASGGAHIAVLPLPDAMYARDFSTAQSRGDYARLRSSARRVISAPLLASRHAVAKDGEPRNHQYAWIGAFIAKRADVLIALWDGAPARGTGGTAQVVDWYLADKTPPQYRISRAPRLAKQSDVAAELVHINPTTHRVRRIARDGRKH